MKRRPKLTSFKLRLWKPLHFTDCFVESTSPCHPWISPEKRVSPSEVWAASPFPSVILKQQLFARASLITAQLLHLAIAMMRDHKHGSIKALLSGHWQHFVHLTVWHRSCSGELHGLHGWLPAPTGLWNEYGEEQIHTVAAALLTATVGMTTLPAR